MLKSLFEERGARQDSEALDRLFRSELGRMRPNLESGLAVLGTLVANAPFIGLFGTVLGIIQAFAALGMDSSGTAGIMSGISRALFATAAGLFVAIPAVVAFNYFSKQIKEQIVAAESLKDLLVSRFRVRD